MFNNTKIAFNSKSNTELKKAYYLFRLIENPTLTKLSTSFFKIPYAIHFPLVKWVIRKSVFKQFVGGENTKQSIEVAKKLKESNVCSILDYSIEGKTEEEEFNNTKNEILRLISIAKKHEEFPFVVFKPTAFGKIELYEKVGNKSNLTELEQQQWQNIKTRFLEVCQEAYNKNVTIMIDAEESWMQDAADDLATDMMKKFNRETCTVCNTLQMYRHDRLDYLKKIFEQAEQENFQLGFKIVRGAYMEKERERADEKGYASPIQKDKDATDKDYNLALEFIMENHNRISLFAGTHNEYSSEFLTQLIQNKGLKKENHKIWFGQLFGMSDNISYTLADHGYNVAKYLPYGPIKEVLPYLLRRAEENTSVKGQSGRELRLIKEEVKRRKSK